MRLTAADGTVLGKAENSNGRLKVEQVEKLVESEIKKREEALKERMEDAKSKAKSGDNTTAIAEYRAVLEQKCLFPKRAKDVAKDLKKPGVTDVAEIPDSPNMDAALSARIERTMAPKIMGGPELRICWPPGRVSVCSTSAKASSSCPFHIEALPSA